MSKRKSNSELEVLKDIWYGKLKESGFVDIEDDRQNLKQPDTRTLAFRNQDIILDFFLKLDCFLNERPDLNPLHRNILEMYSKGKRINYIAAQVNRSRGRIHSILAFYKRVIKNGHLI